MGCCNSRPSSAPSSPPTAAAATASSRNIATSSPPRRTSSNLSQDRRSGSQTALHISAAAAAAAQSSAAPNRPLVGIAASRRAKLPGGARDWTPARLAREREDFFDTRVTGAPEVWGVVRMVVELVRGGQIEEAQGVLDASGCTCPMGEVWRGIFDERGAFYQVPEWVVIEPNGLVPESEAEDGKEEGGDESEEKAEPEGVRTEKGKGRAVEVDVGELVKVRARLSDRGTDVQVKIGMAEKVAALVARVRGLAAIQSHVQIRIMYLGHTLREDKTLDEQGWQAGHTVSVFVFSQ